MADKHAKLSPSKAEMWMNCPGSIRMAQGVPDRGGPDADQGTACHLLLQRRLMEKLPPSRFKSVKVGDTDEDARQVNVTPDMIRWVEDVAQYVESYVKQEAARTHKSVTMRCEVRVDVGGTLDMVARRGAKIGDAYWGTADVVITSADRLSVFDAKFGFNEVDVTENPQIGSYAIGAGGVGFPAVVLGILQPRAAQPVKLEHLTGSALAKRAVEYRSAALAALKPDAPLVPSEKACAYCPAAGVCPALQKHAMDVAREEFLDRPEHLTPEQISYLLGKADLIRKALLAVERYAEQQAACGRFIPGFKRVRANTRRAWREDVEPELAAMAKMLGVNEKQLYDTKLKSPAQLEKTLNLRPGQLDALAPKPPGEPVLVPEDDPRPALAADFEKV